MRLCLDNCGDFADPKSRNGSRCTDCESSRNTTRNHRQTRQVYQEPSYKTWQLGDQCEEPGCTRRDDLTKDHIIPISAGGTNHPSNLRTLCRSHNSSKGSSQAGASS